MQSKSRKTCAETRIRICDKCQKRDIKANIELFLKQKMEQGYTPELLTEKIWICSDCGKKVTTMIERQDRRLQDGYGIGIILCNKCGKRRNKHNNL